MKIVQQNLTLNQPGSVKIILEEHDDLWLVYNLIARGDTIVTDTARKVVRNKSSVTNANRKDCFRVQIKIEIKITDVDYDDDSSALRVRGRNLVANELMASGAYHTLKIEKNKEFDLTKKLWDSDAIENLHKASEKASRADLAVIIIQTGSAQVFLIGNKVTTLCAKIEASKTNNKTVSNKFYAGIFQAFVKHVDFNTVRCVVLGSPGSIKEEFRGYLFQEAQRLKMKSIGDNKSRFVMVNIGNKNSLKEILHDDQVMGLIKDTKAVMEIKAYKEFSDLLLTDSDRACYGPRSVETAHEMMAIEALLITDDLLRSKDIALRQKYMELVKSVKKAGGKAIVFSSTHVSGEQLAQLTGIAAILRFPLPDLDELIL
ncbi:protein PELOTA 1-like [Durio zibethinus]|uniref:Protein pelota homolog n=1 Tax=Durio zibethinus TaxID=66656 RepID=A0A6P5YQ40_DURZI|nr:protein PELOTA 1-like [Durio zibethinus]